MEPNDTQQGLALDDPVTLQRQMSSVLDSDPALLKDMDKALGPPPATTTPPSPAHAQTASLWERLKATSHRAAESFDAGLNGPEQTGLAISRGVVKAVDQTSDAIVGSAVGLSKAIGAYKIGRNAEEQSKFLKWWSQPTAKANPLRFGEDNINKWMGPSAGGINGFVEGAAQFATGMAGAKEISGLKAVAGVKGIAMAAAVDATVFDPHQQRLSNLVENGPEWMSNPITRFLKSKPDDTEAEGRLKNSLEGSFIGTTIEGLVAGLRTLKGLKGEAHVESPGAAPSSDVVGIQETPAGTFAVTEVPQAAEEAIPTSGSIRRPMTPAEHVVAAREKLPSIEAQLAATTDPLERAALDAHADVLRRTANREVPKDAPVFATRADAENAAVSINVAAKNETLPRGALQDTHAEAWASAMDALREQGDGRGAQDILRDAGVNINYVQSPEEVVNTVKALAQIAPEPSAVSRGIPRTFAEIAKDAEGMFAGMSGEETAQRMATIFGGTDKLDAHILGMRQWMWAQAAETEKLARLATANPENAVATEQLAKALDTLGETHAFVTGTSSNIARALSIHQMPVGEALENSKKALTEGLEEGTNPEALQSAADATGASVEGPATVGGQQGPAQTTSSNAGTESLIDHRAPKGPKVTEGLTQTEIRSLARTIFMVEGDPAKMLVALRGYKVLQAIPQEIRATRSKQVWDFLTAVRMEAMLSGPKTHVTNMLSNTMAMLQRPSEYWVGGVLSKNPALRQQGADMLGGMFDSARESWTAMKKAFLTGQNQLDPGNSATGSGMISWSDASFVAKLGNFPSRALMSSDEFFKQMNYRVNLKSQILRQAREQGITNAGELAKRVKEDMQFAFDPEGGAVNPLALQYARIGTFTNDLEGGMGAWLQKGAQEHPLIRLIVPFVRTPVNIFRYAWERTPVLNRRNAAHAADIAAGGERAAIATARTAMGTALYTTAATLAASGQITGAGPTDPDLRKQWKEAGHQPYSLKIPGTNRWVSYRRADPTFMPLGLVADIYTMAGSLGHEDRSNAIAATVASIAANVTSKTFMQGISEFMDAMSNGDPNKVEHLLSSTVGSFSPNILRQMNPDDTIRETRGMLDEMMARVPGFSTTLEPKRNMFGEKVVLPPAYGMTNRTLNPFTLSAPVGDGNVADELLKLGRAFSMPAETKNNIDLTNRDLFKSRVHPERNQSPYDRMLELMSEPEEGKSLRQQLEHLVQTDTYKHASAGGDVIQKGGPKWQMAAAKVTGAQNRAWGRVLREYPDLRTALRQDGQAQGAAMRGGQDAVNTVMGKYSQKFIKTQ